MPFGLHSELTLGFALQVKLNPDLESRTDIPARWWNAAIPIGLIIILVIFGLILTGIDAVQADPELPMSIQNVFGEGDSSNSLLWATLVVTILTWGLFRFTYHDGKRLMTMFRGKRTEGAQPMMHFKGAVHECLPAQLCTCDDYSKLPGKQERMGRAGSHRECKRMRQLYQSLCSVSAVPTCIHEVQISCMRTQTPPAHKRSQCLDSCCRVRRRVDRGHQAARLHHHGACARVDHRQCDASARYR